MDSAHRDEMVDVWGRVQSWPEQLRLSLASRILHSLQAGQQPRRRTLADLVGLLATDQPPPTDEAVARILEEHRTQKFG